MINASFHRATRRFPVLTACSAAILLAGCSPDTTGDATRTAASLTAVTRHLYVSPYGADGNPGSQDAPFRTLNRAGAAATPGTTVHVAPGAYPGNVTTQTSGTAIACISFVSDSKWGARITGAGNGAMWTNDGNYVDITGFDITGPGRLGVLNNGSDTLIANNHIHDLAISGGCTGSGGAAVVNAAYGAANGDIIGNVVHDIGAPGACNGVQGLYSSNRGGKIMNNIVYRVSAYGIHLWHAATDAVISNNTVFANGSAGMGGGILIGAGDAPGGIQLNNTKVMNNIVYDNPRSGIKEYCSGGESCIGTGNVVSNNLVSGSATPVTMRVGSATGTIGGDPQFVSYNPAGAGDYRLRSGSPAANRSTTAWAPLVDILGVARTNGAVDLGAYESL